MKTRYLFVVAMLFMACGGVMDAESVHQPVQPTQRTSYIVGDLSDPAPVLRFERSDVAMGLDPQNMPASLACSPSTTTDPHGVFAADFSGDGLMDVYTIDHNQGCGKASGLWVQLPEGGFSKNIWAGAFRWAPTNGTSPVTGMMVSQIADFTGDGKVDALLAGWGSQGSLCVNQGVVTESDWSGPVFHCYLAERPVGHGPEGLAFGDVNGDGKPDIRTFSGSYDTSAHWRRTHSTHWHLNNGSENFSTWPTEEDERVFSAVAAPGLLLDLNADGLLDRIEIPDGVSGIRVFLGTPNGSYVQQADTGLESTTAYVVDLKDLNGDGCVDVGIDPNFYMNNQRWHIQNKANDACLLTFAPLPNSDPTLNQLLVMLGYHPGYWRRNGDLDGDGLADLVTTINTDYELPPGGIAGLHIYRRTVSDGWIDTAATLMQQFNVGISGFGSGWNQNITIADWNDDGKPDILGAGGVPTAFNAVWTNITISTNRHVTVVTPDISGFFVGPAQIEVFDSGFLGDLNHLASEPLTLRTGNTWPTKKHTFGIGSGRSTVDVRVTFPTGAVTTSLGVPANATVSITPTQNQPPVASIVFSPAAANIGVLVAFDGTASTDSDGSIVSYQWDFGDGSVAVGSAVMHAYAQVGTYSVRLTVADNQSSTAQTTVLVAVTDAVPPATSFGAVTVALIATDDSGFVASVSCALDGQAHSVDTDVPFSATVDFQVLSSGTHVLSCESRDQAGNVSAPVYMTLEK